MLPGVCLPLGEELSHLTGEPGRSPQVTTSIAGKATEKNVPLSFFSLLYPVYTANKFNFQELEEGQRLICLKGCWAASSSPQSTQRTSSFAIIPKRTEPQQREEKGVRMGERSPSAARELPRLP